MGKVELRFLSSDEEETEEVVVVKEKKKKSRKRDREKEEERSIKEEVEEPVTDAPEKHHKKKKKKKEHDEEEAIGYSYSNAPKDEEVKGEGDAGTHETHHGVEPSQCDTHNQFDEGYHVNPKIHSQLTNTENMFSKSQFKYRELLQSCKGKNLGIYFKKYTRHFSFPWQFISQDRIRNNIIDLVRMDIGKWSHKLNSLVLAFDKSRVQLLRMPRVIDDQNCFHCDAVIKYIVLRPKYLQKMECQVVNISDTFVVCLFLGMITVRFNRDNKLDGLLKGVTLEEGDIVKVTYVGAEVKRGICQFRGNFYEFVRKGKGEPLKYSFIQEKPQEMKPKPNKKKSSFGEYNKSTTLKDLPTTLPVNAKQRIIFADSDDSS